MFEDENGLKDIRQRLVVVKTRFHARRAPARLGLDPSASRPGVPGSLAVPWWSSAVPQAVTVPQHHIPFIISPLALQRRQRDGGATTAITVPPCTYNGIQSTQLTDDRGRDTGKRERLYACFLTHT